MGIKNTVEELKKMIKCAPLLEAPADGIVADLAQQLIDVQKQIGNLVYYISNDEDLISDTTHSEREHMLGLLGYDVLGKKKDYGLHYKQRD